VQGEEKKAQCRAAVPGKAGYGKGERDRPLPPSFPKKIGASKSLQFPERGKGKKKKARQPPLFYSKKGKLLKIPPFLHSSGEKRTRPHPSAKKDRKTDSLS